MSIDEWLKFGFERGWVVQEPAVSANRGQGNFTDKGENK